MSRILVIQSDYKVRKTISDYLINCGHDVLAAENGKVGLQRCSETIDFIITALLMQEKDGLEVIGEIKAKWPDIKIIVMDTVWGIAPDIDLCKIAKTLGACYVLEQPLNLSELMRVVNR